MLREFRDKLTSIAGPSARIWQPDQSAPPARRKDSSFDICFDGAYNGDDACGPKPGDGRGQRRFRGLARCAPLAQGQLIDGLCAEIHQVAPSALQLGEKVPTIKGTIISKKRSKHRPVQAGVRLIEKASGSGRRFPDEKQTDMRWSKTTAERLTLSVARDVRHDEF
jgi:hypothetical protein